MRVLGFWLALAGLVGCSTVETEPVAGPHGHTEQVYPSTPADTPLPLKNAEYSGATYRQARWFTSGRSRAIDMIVIHTTEGSYSGAISWFQDAGNTYKTSAHYVIRSSDGQITQMVKERDTAHHVRNYNSRSVGIEHEAFIAQSRWYTDAMYRSSAALVRYLCTKYNIPMDRAHIRGHNELDPARRDDPGPHWDWARFMGMVRDGAAPPDAAPPSESPSVPDGDCRFRYWNCTPDRAARVRCEGGREVERQVCGGGCQVMQIGTDDICRPAAQDGQSFGACNAGGLPGTCMHISQCAGEPTPGLCPGDRTIQCCTDRPDPAPQDPDPQPEPNPQPDPDPAPQTGGACTVAGVRGACVDIGGIGGCQGPVDWAAECGDAGACCLPAADPAPVPDPAEDTPPPRAIPVHCTINGVRGECLAAATAEAQCPWQAGAELWQTPECNSDEYLCCVGSAANDGGEPAPGEAPPADDVWSTAGECDVEGEWGLCVPTAACRGDGGEPTPGYCPGAIDIQCCTWR